MTVSTAAGSAVAPESDSFAWTVLTTLAQDATARVTDGRFEITLMATSSIGRPEAAPGSRPLT